MTDTKKEQFDMVNRALYLGDLASGGGTLENRIRTIGKALKNERQKAFAEVLKEIQERMDAMEGVKHLSVLISKYLVLNELKGLILEKVEQDA